jgi:hypothetical protein
MDQLAEGNLAIQRLMVREPEIDFKRQRTPTERTKSETSRAASCRAEEERRATEEVAATMEGAEADPWSCDGGREGKRNWEGVEEEEERRKRRADRFQSPPQGAEEGGRVAEEVAATKEEAEEVAGTKEGAGDNRGSGGMVRESDMEGTPHKPRRMRAPWTSAHPAQQGAEEARRVAEEVAATKEESEEVAGTKEGAGDDRDIAGRAAEKKRR